MDEPDYDLAGMPAADGAAARFLAFLDEHGREKPAQFLKRAWDYLDAEGLAGDELVHEWTGGIAGDEYPMPDRILRYTQEIVNRYLVKALDDGHAPATPYDLFATEGGTAAMCYLFYSLKCNFLVNPGDRIALMTPIFTPYLNIPILNDYDLDVTYIQANTIDADGLHTWQYPDSELEKLRDPSIKLLCLVNPSNPPSVALDDASRAKLVSLVKNERPDLIIISDDVYGTFVPHYRSLLDDLPYNTACVYSFSKYFGATGWRLAVIATAAEQRVRRPHREAARGQEAGAREPLRVPHRPYREGEVHRPHGGRLAARGPKRHGGTRHAPAGDDVAVRPVLPAGRSRRIPHEDAAARAAPSGPSVEEPRLDARARPRARRLLLGDRPGNLGHAPVRCRLLRVAEGKLRLAGHRGAARPGHRRRAHGRPRLRRPGMVGARIAGEPERRRLHRHRPAPLGHAGRLRRGMEDGEVAATSRQPR